MSDQPQTPNQLASDVQQPNSSAQGGQQAQDTQQPGPVPYERFKEVNEQLRQLQTRLATIDADKKKADEAKLKEDGKLQELLTTRERELADERAARLRLSVATKKGLVGELAPLADRLRGTTEQELEADADALLALAKKPAGHGVPPAGTGGRSPALDLKSMTPAQIREARAKGQLK